MTYLMLLVVVEQALFQICKLRVKNTSEDDIPPGSAKAGNGRARAEVARRTTV